MKIGTNNGKQIVAAEWVDQEVQSHLKDRKAKNKKWRKARNEKKSQETLKKLEEDYKNQQRKTSQHMGMKKGAWEKKRSNKQKETAKYYGMQPEKYQEKEKNKNEQIYLYRKDMTRHKAQEDWSYFIGDWKVDIYQKKIPEYHQTSGMEQKRLWD